MEIMHIVININALQTKAQLIANKYINEFMYPGIHH